MPHLRRGFEDAVFVYLPSVFPLHFPIRGGAAVITGTAPTLVNLNGNVSVQIPNVGVTSYIAASTGTQNLDFSTSGFTCLVVGSYYNTNGTQPIETLIRRNGDGAGNGGFTTALYNTFGGTPASVFSSYDKPGTGDSNYDSVWVNGVKATTGNGDPGTSVNTRYVLAVNTATGPGSGATTEFIIGRGTSAQDSSSNIEFAIVFPRKLPEPLMQQLTLDPYFVFEPAADLTFFSAPSASVPYVSPAQLMSQPPSSYAPTMRFASAAATALAVVAGTYVPSGPVAASPARQAQIAYREAARLTTQITPVPTVGPTIGPTVPAGSTSPLQAQIAYREAARLPQSILPFAAPPVAAFTGVPGATPAPAPAPWPYAKFVTFPAYSPGVAPPYVLSPALVPVVEPPWPYANFVTFPNYSPGIAPAYAYSPAINPVRQPEWPYAATKLPAPTASEWAIATAYVGPSAPQAPRVAEWPYASAVALEAQPAATAPVASPVPFATLPLLASAAWPYTVTISPAFLTLAPVTPPPPLAPVSVTLVPAPWPYAVAMPAAPTVNGSVAPYAFFGLAPVAQWLSYPPWPYAGTMLPAPTASAFGVAPAPPVVSPGSNALRRWVIQQYQEYFQNQEQAKLSKPQQRRAEAAKRTAKRFPAHVLPPDTDLSAAFRLANELAAGSLDINARVVRLEETKALPPELDTSRITKLRTQQQRAQEEDDDMLLLAMLFNEGA